MSSDFLSLIDYTKKTLHDITVRVIKYIEEDTKALFYQENSNFEDLFKDFTAKLAALKQFILYKKHKKTEKIFTFLKNFKEFEI